MLLDPYHRGIRFGIKKAQSGMLVSSAETLIPIKKTVSNSSIVTSHSALEEMPSPAGGWAGSAFRKLSGFFSGVNSSGESSVSVGKRREYV